MMERRRQRIAFSNFHASLNENNLLFTSANTAIGDDLLRPLLALRDHAESIGVQVGTVAVIPPEEADAIVFIDMPDASDPALVAALRAKKPVYLMVVESKIIRPQNYDPERLAPFTKVFTYDDSTVDGEKFIKLNYAFDLPRQIDTDSSREKFCTMIVGYKRSRHPDGLYAERVRAIRWFEKNHPEDFDLYGMGWDKYRNRSFKPRHYLNPFRVAKIIFHKPFVSFRGPVDRKLPVLSQYRFSICYENIANVPGYITEKIFDAFFAGTVPVYLGADNVARHIPQECFVDKRKFPTYEGLYDYLKGMDEETYRGYRKAIQRFLSGPASEAFSIRKFVGVIAGHVFQ